MERSNDGAMNNILERSSTIESMSMSRSKKQASRQSYAQEKYAISYDSSNIEYGMTMDSCMSSQSYA
jgi:hypothetical protein